MLNAVNALPQLEQADKLIARMPPAKWAAETQNAASEFLHIGLLIVYLVAPSCTL